MFDTKILIYFANCMYFCTLASSLLLKLNLNKVIHIYVPEVLYMQIHLDSELRIFVHGHTMRPNATNHYAKRGRGRVS